MRKDSRKNSRLEFRLDEDLRLRAHLAAKAEAMTLGAFVRRALDEASRRRLLQEGRAK
jgi:predicted HicB family RNase H-like nuclease